MPDVGSRYEVNRLREQRILVGTDGPFHNVIEIRPPMAFTAEDAELLVARLDGALTELRWHTERARLDRERQQREALCPPCAHTRVDPLEGLQYW